jgi:hypothetical protein
VVCYKNLIRIVFETLGLARVAEGILGQEILDILDIIKPGNIWEIIRQNYRKKI